MIISESVSIQVATDTNILVKKSDSVKDMSGLIFKDDGCGKKDLTSSVFRVLDSSQVNSRQLSVRNSPIPLCVPSPLFYSSGSGETSTESLTAVIQNPTINGEKESLNKILAISKKIIELGADSSRQASIQEFKSNLQDLKRGYPDAYTAFLSTLHRKISAYGPLEEYRIDISNIISSLREEAILQAQEKNIQEKEEAKKIEDELFEFIDINFEENCAETRLNVMLEVDALDFQSIIDVILDEFSFFDFETEPLKGTSEDSLKAEASKNKGFIGYFAGSRKNNPYSPL